MEQKEIEKIAESFSGMIETVGKALDHIAAQTQPQQQAKPEYEISKGVQNFLGMGEPDMKGVSSSVQAWLKGKANPDGKPLGPKQDEGPIRLNGELTGRKI